jgi:hypothetical protein
MKSFTFSILVFNHEEWILEHLESIKYLVLKYKPPIVDLLISDDKSIDRSRKLVDCWLVSNGHLFRNIEKIYNEVNVGTVICTKNIIKKCETDLLKITAGDDVYSFENIFHYSNMFCRSSIVSGLPYYLKDSNLTNETFSNVLHITSSLIYRDYNRFDMLHATNAPNILYNVGQLREIIDSSLFDRVKLVEDLLIQVLLSSRKFSFTQLYIPLVYYRRTSGSSYLIKGSQFDFDQRAIMDFQIYKSSCFKKLFLRNKYFCFGIKNKSVKYLVNIPFYIFLIKSILKFPKIIKKLSYFNKYNDISIHKRHYSLIAKAANIYENSID